MTVVVFVGPTLQRDEVLARLPDAVVRGPAACGDVYRATRENPQAIALIDGYFDQRLSVWHKEILWALSRGQRVYGASSMGALRAAELDSLGMIGVGRVYELFASGALEDDDEVAIVHDPAEEGYRARSEAMVNIRATLEAAVRAGVISEQTRDSLVGYEKGCFYAGRSYTHMLRHAVDLGAPPDEVEALSVFLRSGGAVDRKRLDAIEMLEAVAAEATRTDPRPRPAFRFAYTNAWHVFREKIDAQDFSSPPNPSAGERPELAREQRECVAALERLRVSDPELATRVWTEAIERALALTLAEHQGYVPDAALTQLESEAFRRARGLLEPDHVEAWFRENDMDIGSFSELVYDEVLVRRHVDSARQLALGQITNVLRLRSKYVASRQKK